MLFDSLDFAIFLPIVFAVYWLLNRSDLRWQNGWMLLVSYTFYGWWDWRFLILILVSTVADYFVALLIHRKENPEVRKRLLWLSVAINLGLLCFFKYANFFIDSFSKAFTLFGWPIGEQHLNIILPVGISFYTFQTISYTVDVYRSKVTPTKDFIIFAGFVSFFPQLVAGPIERAKNLLPQFQQKRTFDEEQAIHGLRQILWGLFKKVVIANNCALYVDQLFSNIAEQSAINLLIGCILFSFQVYSDFSGYSDIAIGTARLFGFRLQINFSYPLFSRNMGEFWGRWHISLMTWLRDYIFVPLARGKRKSSRKWYTLLIFLISGLWHGASFSFISWGLMMGIFCILYKGKVSNQIVNSLSLKTVGQIIMTNLIFALSAGFFRGGKIQISLQYYSGLFDLSLFAIPDFLNLRQALFMCAIISAMMIIEWWGRHGEYGIAFWAGIRSRTVRWTLYLLLILSIGLLNQGDQTQFLYFQF